MARRILPLLLIVALLPALLAVPARADEVKFQYIELFDYTTPNGSGSYTVSVSPNNQFVNFTLPYTSDLKYVEVLFSLDGSFLTPGLYLSDGQVSTYMNVEYLGDTLYRAYCACRWDNTNSFSIRFTGLDAARDVTFYSLLYTPESFQRDNLAADGNIHDIGNNSFEYYLYHKANGESNIPEWRPNTNNTSFVASFQVLDWEKYDYVDIVCTSYCSDITSIAVSHGIGSVPFTVNEINGGSGYGLFVISLRLDLSELDKTSTNNPLVEITGLGDPAHFSNFNIRYCSGVVVVPEPNILVYWFTELAQSISIQTNAITSSISNGITRFVNSVTSGFSDTVNAIQTWGKNIVDALTGSDDASQVTDSINNAVNDLHQAGAAMDAVSRPDIGQVNIDVAGMVSTSGMSAVASLVNVFTGNPLILTIMIMAFTLALISFVLFGER